MPDPGAGGTNPNNPDSPYYDPLADVAGGGGGFPPPAAADEPAEEEEEFVAGDAREDLSLVDPGDFENQLQQEVRRIVGGWAKEAGYSANAGQAFVNSKWKQAFGFASSSAGGTLMRYGADNMTSFNILLDSILGWMGSRLPFSVPEESGSGSGSRGRGGRRGGGGGGARGPTPDEIRAQFDIDALAEEVNAMSRTFLIQDHADPRSVARAYVEAIVKNPEQKLDFQTFVKGRLKKNNRWNVIFQNKPDGTDEAQYLSRYVQQVQQFVGGTEDASQIAFEQAAIGASQEGLQARLGRTRATRSSSSFVNGFEDQIRGVSEMLR